MPTMRSYSTKVNFSDSSWNTVVLAVCGEPVIQGIQSFDHQGHNSSCNRPSAYLRSLSVYSQLKLQVYQREPATFGVEEINWCCF